MPIKRILGLDLGTTSIGWAFVEESDQYDNKSRIIRTGVRVIPLTTDEQQDFTKGRSITTNEGRRLKRGMRRNLQRYKQRREAVIKALSESGFIDKDAVLSEDFKDSTHHTYKVRAAAPDEKISKIDFARVLLAINKKRGYKSSRKAKNDEDGQLVDGMAIAKRLANENLTPGELNHILLSEGKKFLPDYYRSDLQKEFDLVWEFQSKFYPDQLTDEHRKELHGLNKTNTGQYFEKTIGTERAENKGKEKKKQEMAWRAAARHEKIALPVVAYILTEINNQINQSSGYLGAISDRSKELYFGDMTVGQYQYQLLTENPHHSLRNQVFYRQDYLDEFNAIWEQQSKHYPELTDKLKNELRDITIFFQRPLKSQKGLINICELEGREREVEIDGRKKTKLVGPRVAPKSSPVFQEFKIWGNINAIRVYHKDQPNEAIDIEEETRQMLFDELNWSAGMTDKQFISWLNKNSDRIDKDYKIKHAKLEGNRTNHALLEAYKKILLIEGYDDINWNKPMVDVIENVKSCFRESGIDHRILDFDATAKADEWAKQPSYELWHLLYSYREDSSISGLDSLKSKLQEKFGFSSEHVGILAAVTFQEDYGNLSARAMRKMLPYLEDGMVYSEAAANAGYNHSNAETAEEKKKRKRLDELPPLKKNSLRNPVVEKILNQMINVVNAIMEDPELGRPDEIRVEMARELQKNQQQRADMTRDIAKATKLHDDYRKIIKEEFGLPYVSRRDLIKYKLYRELEPVGYKAPYSGRYISPDKLFSKEVEIEHIIPQAVKYDDSFSNKTLEFHEVNVRKGNMTAYDFVEQEGNLEVFKQRVETLFPESNRKTRNKRRKLLSTKEKIEEGFTNRDKTNTGYITRKALEILKQVAADDAYATSGRVTDILRSDWELIDVLKELNWHKYKRTGMIYFEVNKHGIKLPKIKDWSKRNDHRHHAMDAIAAAFARPAIVQMINNESAKSNQDARFQNLKKKHTYRTKGDGRRFKKPFDNIRQEAKKHLEQILVSFKAKNKVTTLNINKSRLKSRDGKKQFLRKEQSTPRGQLHKETIYGRSMVPVYRMEKIGSSFEEEKIMTVVKKSERDALLSRFRESESDPKKAFTAKNSPSKNPILDIDGNELPEKVRTMNYEEQFTIRKEVNPTNFKNKKAIEKVVDEGIKRKLLQRLEINGNDAKKAFADLESNPIWLVAPSEKQHWEDPENPKLHELGIPLKSVTITGVSNATPLHHAKDHTGEELVEDEGKAIPADYVSTGNNHHVAIYEDEEGNLTEEVVSLYEAVIRKNNEEPIVRDQNDQGHPLKFTLKQNEMFVFPDEDFDPFQINLTDPKNKSLVSKQLFRVQKITSKDYVFRHHLETELNDDRAVHGLIWYRFKSLGALPKFQKVRLNHLGDIVQVGEY